MKTPQEEAESLARQCGFSHASGYDSVQATVMRNIPLPELIAVARVAAQHTNAVGHVEQSNTLDLLIDALIALRATGRVEL